MNHRPTLTATLALLASAALLVAAVQAEETPAASATPPAGHDHGGAPALQMETPFPFSSSGLDFRELEMVAVQEGGRKKPLQTYASEQIEMLVGRPLFSSTPYVIDKLDSTGQRRIRATDLFMALWLQPNEWASAPIVLINYLPLRQELGLSTTQKHFSPQLLANSQRLRQLVESGMKKRQSGAERAMTPLEKEAEVIQQRLDVVETVMDNGKTLGLIPHPSDPNGTWQTLDAFDKSFSAKDGKPLYTPQQHDAIFEQFKALGEAYVKRDADAFSNAARQLRGALETLSPSVYPASQTLEREVTYNTLRPFGKAWMLYLVAVLIGVFALRFKHRALGAGMMIFALAGLAMNVYGFVLRCLVAGRPPVSNMYESVIWVGFGAVFFGLIFELVYRKKLFMICGASAGCLCLVLMDLLPAVMGNPAMPGFEARINPLVPVLRDNFWLTTHVLTITISYAAFMLAWVLGHVALARYMLAPAAKAEHVELQSFVYRAMQAGVLLLAIGTILGGVWAYYAWGRFWGWDPKETWAFIALLCYLFLLHVRFAIDLGLLHVDRHWSNFFVCVGAVICFQAIVMAWYGVNFVLGSGLHAYASGSGGLAYVLPVVILDIIFTVVAVLRYTAVNSQPAGDEAEAVKTPA